MKRKNRNKKIMIVSDIHGSLYYTRKIVKAFEEEKADVLIILGDLYYHGPRNSFPMKYAPIEVSKLLNGLKDKIIAVMGNCDSEVDQMISDFPIRREIVRKFNGNKFLLTHGHKKNIDNYYDERFDIIAYGHFHVNFVKKVGKNIYINPGSVSLPKKSTMHGYTLIDIDNVIYQKSLDKKIVEKYDMNAM